MPAGTSTAPTAPIIYTVEFKDDGTGTPRMQSTYMKLPDLFLLSRTQTTGKGPNVTKAGDGNTWQWTELHILANATIAIGSGTTAYSTPQYYGPSNNRYYGLDPAQGQCAIVLASTVTPMQILLLYTQLGLVDRHLCDLRVADLKVPNSSVLGVVLSPGGNSSDLNNAVTALASSISGSSASPAYRQALGVCQFIGAGCGIAPDGTFGAIL